MTPEELKQNPITFHPNQKLGTDEGESTKDEEEFTMSQELSEEYSTSDITTKNAEESKHTETSQVLTVFNKTINHKVNSSEDKSHTIADDAEGSKNQLKMKKSQKQLKYNKFILF